MSTNHRLARAAAWMRERFADSDGLGAACETLIGTSDSVADSDADGCRDGREVRSDPNIGGGRDPLDYWDIYDVTADASVDVSDTLNILSFFGDDGTSPTANLRDRGRPIAAEGWRSDEVDDAIDLTDALNNLQQFGATC